MECGLIGLPLAGKSTLFDLLTGVDSGRHHPGENRTRRGVCPVHDPRLDAIAETAHSVKVTPVLLEFVDVPGLTKPEERRQPYPANYLAELRATNLLALVVRAFANPAIPHPFETVDPLRDVTEADTEFIINDMAVVEKRLERIAKVHQTGGPAEAALLEKCHAALAAGTPLREVELSADENRALSPFSFLSQKPLLIILNVDEDSIKGSEELEKRLVQQTRKPAAQVAVVTVAEQLETEIALLSGQDQRAYLDDLGIKESAADRVTHAALNLLRMVIFFTGNEKEARAWALQNGATALDAAGAIHADIARGFIRAEVFQWSDFVSGGSTAKLRETGRLRLEGKDYVIADGDYLGIKFNV